MRPPGPQEPITQKDKPTPLMLAFMRDVARQERLEKLIAKLRDLDVIPEGWDDA